MFEPKTLRERLDDEYSLLRTNLLDRIVDTYDKNGDLNGKQVVAPGPQMFGAMTNLLRLQYLIEKGEDLNTEGGEVDLS